MPNDDFGSTKTKTEGAVAPKSSAGIGSSSRPSLPPRPAKADHAGLEKAFNDARSQLDAIMGEQNQRVMELKLNATQSIEQAVTRLEESARFTRTLMERNSQLGREADRLIAEGNSLEAQQDELEDRVEKAAEHTEQLTTRAEALREEHKRLDTERSELEEGIQKDSEALSTARGDVERLHERKEKLAEENSELERIRNRLDENIARLERLRDEYMAAIDRLKNTKDELVAVPGASSSPR